MEPVQQTFRYDVFISFRGEDTRNYFTSHLYATLKRHNFDVFHDTSLPRGLGIAPQLSKAIDESKIFLVVFSLNYADSKWCLDELSQMMQCVHLMNSQQIVLPVFLDVKQSDVGTQQGSYKEPFIKHDIEFVQERVQKWRDALQEAGQLPGLHLQDDANGDEKELLDQVVEKIRKMLHGQDVDVAYMNPVVGIEPRMQEAISLLNGSCEDDVCVLAISGPVGIGKTEIAIATYNQLAIHFKAQYCCFLPNVKALFGGVPNGKVDLQKMMITNLRNDESYIRIDSDYQGVKMIERLIKHQKVLLVLDDVDNDEQLKILGMNRAIFGPGSRIIVTTRDGSVTGRLKPDAIYEPRMLDESESMEVFCLTAFGQKHPKEGYEEVSREAMCWGAGRPGVLKDTAVRLRCFQSVQQWVWALKDLMRNSSW
uniref:disease resistance protein RUN1-like isoform X1 n=1 Tax=Erigeron canadensis TaxID=72917 RepID=UPI001CB92AD4|nr:disease resistance protein RUN1-like isoform X1 [Erigeron canadensis]